MDAGQFFALLTVASLVGLFLSFALMDDYKLGDICLIFQKVFTVLLVVGLAACVWIAAGVSVSLS